MDRVLGVVRHPSALSVRLLAAGWAELAPGGWSWRQLQKPFWSLYRNDADGARVTVGGRTVDLAAGRGWLIPAWTPLRTACSATIRHLYLYLDLTGLPEGMPGPSVPPALPTPAGAALGWLDALAAGGPRPLGWGEQARLLALVLDTVAPWLPERPTTADPRLEPALALMTAHPERRFTVAALARHCRLGDDAFTRRFRAALGTTPVQHLRRLRAERAAHLLRTTADGADAIAAACGLGNRTYMTRVFRAVFARTPAAVRRGEWDDAFPLGVRHPGPGRWHHSGFGFRA